MSAGLALEIDREHREGTILVRARGELDLQTAASLCTRVDAEIRAPRSRVLLDLAELSFCDSTGLRMLMGLTQEAQAHRTRLIMVVPPDTALARLVELSGTAEFLPLVDHEDAGLRLLAPRA